MPPYYCSEAQELVEKEQTGPVVKDDKVLIRFSQALSLSPRPLSNLLTDST